MWTKSLNSLWKIELLDKKKTDTSSWNHVAGKDNPPDLPTRGSQLGELLESDHWWHGPSWLSLPKDCWPQPLSKLEPTTEAIAEMKRSVRNRSLK